MKKGLLNFVGFSILLIGMVSAYSYNPSSMGSLFEMIGGQDLGLLIVFSVSLALITVILNRTSFFEESKGASIIIALMLSFGITYGFYQRGVDFDISDIFYNLGVSDFILDLGVSILVIISIIVILLKFKLESLIIIGGTIIMLFLTIGLPIEIAIIGGIMALVWGVIKGISFLSGKKGTKVRVYYGDKEKKQSNVFVLVLLGIGIIAIAILVNFILALVLGLVIIILTALKNSKKNYS